MTKREFLGTVPHIIEHETSGYGEIEIVVNRKELVGVCYRHRDKTASYGTYKRTWQELHDDLVPFLREHGHMA